MDDRNIFIRNRIYRLRNINKKNIVLGSIDAYLLNRTAKFLLENIDGKKNVVDISLEYAKKYSISNERAMDDTRHILSDFLDKGIVLLRKVK